MKSGWNYLYYKELDSTMLELERLHSIAPRSQFLIRAENQISGMGRSRNRWYSPAGGLWFSFNQFYPWVVDSFALYIGYCLHKTLVRLYPSLADDIRIKWPNDLYWQKFKLAGILSRFSPFEDNYSVGIGINTNNEISDYEGIETISLRKIVGSMISNQYLLQSIMQEVNDSLDTLNEPGQYLDYCDQQLYRKGELATLDMGEKKVSGVINSLSKTGGIIIDSVDYNFGSLRFPG
ncbi:MAG TPA: biotin--[acetyl-CoA-carboxylase] ligase [Candidatus Cloacimonadota bacterium]|nr:biotin--[acetyl-CoA-carboxylase] ligase [Candidatus Cloacimonadota bacterium]